MRRNIGDMPRKSRSGRSSYETKRTSMRGNENFFAKGLTNALFCGKLIKSSGVMPRSRICADVAELADALDSGSSESNFMWVQVPSSAPKRHWIVPVPFFFYLYCEIRKNERNLHCAPLIRCETLRFTHDKNARNFRFCALFGAVCKNENTPSEQESEQ